MATDPLPYARPRAGTQPPTLYPDYASTQKRAPKLYLHSFGSGHLIDRSIQRPGWTIAMQNGDYRGAVAILHRYFEHPDVEEDYRIYRLEFRCTLAISLLEEITVFSPAFVLAETVPEKHPEQKQNTNNATADSAAPAESLPLFP